MLKKSSRPRERSMKVMWVVGALWLSVLSVAALYAPRTPVPADVTATVVER